VQTKDALTATLAAVGLPQPATAVVRSAEELLHHGKAFLGGGGACVIKATTGTASLGLHRVRSERGLDELAAAIASSAAHSLSAAAPLIVQEMLTGPLERLQAVFADGKLAAIHCFRQLAAGLGGGDVVKESVSRPIVVDHMHALGEHLHWHGALSFDYFLRAADPASPRYIDANPRLVEPVNAQLSGVDLAETLLRVAQGERTGPLALGRPGVRTRLGIPGLIDRASVTGRRTAVFGDFLAQLLKTGRYAGSTEELTPSDDRASPYWGVLFQLLSQPATANAISRQTVESYALGPRGHDFVRSLGLS